MAQKLNITLSLTADATQAKAQIKALQQELQNLAKTAGGNTTNRLGITKEINDAVLKVNELRAVLRKATDDATGKLDLSKFNQALVQSGTSIKQYRDSLYALGPQGQKAFTQLATSVANADARILSANSSLKKMAVTLANTIRWQIAASAINTIVGSVQAAVGYVEDLDKSLNKIRIVSGQSSDQMAQFAVQANKAAQALSTTTTAYTDASLIFFQQGLTGDAVTERTNAVIKMAQVTGDSVEEVSSYMTAVWNNFDEGSKSLEYYADVIAKLGAATASSSSEISQGLEKFAAVAQASGLSYEYATSALATIVAATRQSADTVGTSLKTLFARIQDLELGKTLDDGTTLGKYSQALEAVGVNIKDVNGDLKSMDTILDELGARWGTLTDDIKIAVAQAVGGTRQYNQLIALMDNWQSMQQNIATARGAEGTINQQAAIYAESWEAAQKRVKAASQEIYKALIDEKFFIGVDNTITKLLNGTAGLIKNLGGVQGVISTLASFILSKFNNEIATGIDNLIFKFKNLGKDSEAIRKETVTAAIEELNQGPAASTNETEAKFLKDRLNLQSLLITYNKNMTDVQKEAYALQLDMLTAQKDEIVNTQKQLDLTKEQVALDQKRAQALAVGFAQRKAKEEQKEALAEQKQLEKRRDDIQKQLDKQKIADVNSQKKQLEDEKKRITDDIANARKEFANLPKQRKEAENYLETHQKTFNKKGGDRATWNEYSNKLKDNGEGDYYTRRDKELRQNIRKLEEAEKKAESNITAFDSSKIDTTVKNKSAAYKDLEMQLKEAEKAIENFNKNNAAKINFKFDRDKVKADIEKQFTNLRAALETEVKIDPFKESLQKISSSKTIPEMQEQWKALREEVEKSGLKVKEVFGNDLVKALEAPHPNLIKIRTEIQNLRKTGATGRENFALTLINDFGFDESTTSDLIARMQSCTSTEEALKVMTEALGKATKGTEGGLRQFSNATVTTGQKIQTSIQAFSNLSMALNTIAGSVATLTSDDAGGLQKLSAIFMIATTSIRAITAVSEAFALKTKKTTAAVAGEAAAQAVDAAATTANGAAHDKASGSIGKLKDAFKGAGKAAGITTAVIMGLVLVTEAIKNAAINAAEAQMKSAEADIKRAEATKEELEAQKELYDAYKDALKTYENTGEGKAKLIETAQKAALAYGVEGAEIAALTGNYQALTKAMEEAENARLQSSIGTEQTIQSNLQSKANAISAKQSANSTWIDGVMYYLNGIGRIIDAGEVAEADIATNRINDQFGKSIVDLDETNKAIIKLQGSATDMIQQYDAILATGNSTLINGLADFDELYNQLQTSVANERQTTAQLASKKVLGAATFKDYKKNRDQALKDIEKFGDEGKKALKNTLLGTEEGSMFESLAQAFESHEGWEEIYDKLKVDNSKTFINFMSLFSDLKPEEAEKIWTKYKAIFEQVQQGEEIELKFSSAKIALENLKEDMQPEDWTEFFKETAGIGWTNTFKETFKAWNIDQQKDFINDILENIDINDTIKAVEEQINGQLALIQQLYSDINADNVTSSMSKIAEEEGKIAALYQRLAILRSQAAKEEKDNLTQAREELEKIKIGDILDKKTVDILNISTENIDKYLMEMSDGTYRLVNAAEEFVKTIKYATFKDQYDQVKADFAEIDNKFKSYQELSSDLSKQQADQTSEFLKKVEQYNQLSKQIGGLQLQFDREDAWDEEHEKRLAYLQDLANDEVYNTTKEEDRELDLLTAQKEAFDYANSNIERLKTERDTIDIDESHYNIASGDQERLDKFKNQIKDLIKTFDLGEDGKEILELLENPETFEKGIKKFNDLRDDILKKESASWAATIEDFKQLDDFLKETGDVDSYSKQWENLNNELERTGVSIQELDGYKKYLDNFKGGIIALDADTEQLGEEVLRTNGGFADLISNFTKWDNAMQHAKPGTQAYYDALNGLRNATANLLDVDPARLDDNFLTDPEVHALFIRVVSGDTEAIKELHNELIEFTVSTYEGLEDLIAPLQDELSHIQIGGEVSEEFLAKLQEFIEKLGISQTEAENLLGIIGLEGYNYKLNEAGIVESFASARRKAQGAFATYDNNIQQKKSVKGDKSQFKTEVERYHEINKVLEDMERKLKRIENVKSKAFGPAKVKAIKDEVGMLNAENKAYEERLREANEYLQMDRAKVLSLGAQLDENGIITNYSQVAASLNNQYNQSYVEYINAQNAAIAAYNQTGNQDAYDKALDAINEKWKAVQQLNKENVDALKQYEDTIKQIEEDEIKLEELKQQKYEAEIEEIEVRVNLKVSLSETQMKRIDFQLKLLGDDIDKATDRILKYGETADAQVLNAGAAEEGIRRILSHAGADEDLINRYMTNGLTEEDLSGLKLTEQDVELLEGYTDKLISAYGTIMEQQKKVWEEVDKVLQETTDEFEKLDATFERISKRLGSYQNIINTVGKNILDPTGELTRAIATAQIDISKGAALNRKNQLDTYKSQAEDLRKAIAEGTQKGTKEEAENRLKEMEKTISETENLYLEEINNLAEAWKTAFDLANQQIFEDFEKQATGAAGSFEFLNMQYDFAEELADQVVPEYERIYDLSKLTRDITNSINDSKLIAGNEKLAQLQDDITAEMNKQEMSSKYSLDYLRMRYELLLAEMQLEEARNNKTSLKLKRDSQGNYSYQYGVDEDAISAAQQNYEDKLYAMQKFNDDFIQEQQKLLATIPEQMTQALSALDPGDPQYDEKRQAIIDHYQKLYDTVAENLKLALGNQRTLYLEDWSAYNEATGYKISSEEKFMDTFEETLLSQTTGYKDLDKLRAAFTEASLKENDALAESHHNYTEGIKHDLEECGLDTEKFSEIVYTALGQANKEIAETGRISDETREKFSAMSTSVIADATKTSDEIELKAKAIAAAAEAAVTSLEKFRKKAVELADAINSIPNSFERNYKLVYDIVTNGEVPDLSELPNSDAKAGSDKQTNTDLKENSDYLPIGAYNNSNNYLLLDYYSHANLAQIDAAEGQGAAYTRAAFISKDRNRRVKIVYPYSSYDTGGYTGNWNSSEGRLAMLHQKELVLNASDTSNMLEMVSAVRDLAGAAQANVAGNIAQMIADNIASALYNTTTINNGMQQQVTINADFPAATSAYEIETALNSLVNKATQRAGISQNYR